jgi:hypothetical protein
MDPKRTWPARKFVEIANDVKRELGMSGAFLPFRLRSIGDHGI